MTNERPDLQLSPEGSETETGSAWTERRPAAVRSRADFDDGAGREHALEFTSLRETADAADVDKVRRHIEAMPLPTDDRDGRLSAGPHLYRFVWGSWRVMRVRVTESPPELRPGVRP